MLSVESLMQPRYKVIADYPGTQLKIGEVMDDYFCGWFSTKKNCYSINEKDLKKYLHLFKKLEWWEERKVEDMPEYVKNLNGSVYKVRSHLDHEDKRGWGFVADHDGDNRYYCFYLPATKEEYEQYQQSKNKRHPTYDEFDDNIRQIT